MVKFILNNKPIDTRANTGLTLLHFIREEQNLKGTKTGCKEGDCGACTVLSGTLQKNNSIDYKIITSCLTPLANAHGKHIVTIEGLNLDRELNVSQKAIKDNYATQCGFCTPGFVVSFSGLALKNKNGNYNDSLNAISGNICRCTGYKSIEKAAYDLSQKLIQKENNIDWLIDNKFIPAYFKGIPEKLKKISKIETLLNGTLVAGGTDIYVRNADSLAEKNIRQVVDFDSVKIDINNNFCKLSANTTVTDLLDNKQFVTFFPGLKSFLKLVSSEPIRNMATLAGNFVNASPIGDMSIFFLALDSVLEIFNNNGESRELPLKNFFKSYKVFDLKESEVIKSIFFNLPESFNHFNFEKVSKRTHLDIASVNTAIKLKLHHNKISEAHVSIGGVAAIPLYLNSTSDFLEGKELSIETVREAGIIMQSEISPISDIRGSSAYKQLLARQLFYAHFINLFPQIFQLKNLVA